MSTELLLREFERLSEAPGAISRLRRFILDLAVRGKLTSSEPTDEPVTKLLERIRHGRRRASTRAPDADFSAENRDGPFAVPATWRWISINELGQLSGGLTPSKNRPDFWVGDISWFSSKDIKLDEVRDSELKISRSAVEETRLQMYPPGCLLMVARSGILKRTFPVAINRLPATVNQDLKVLKPYLAGLERYLQVVLRGLTTFVLSKYVKTGTTVQSLKYQEFESIPLPLSPLQEQLRIVAKVDELMALCDRMEAAQAERERRRDLATTASNRRILDQHTDAGTKRESASIHLKDCSRFLLRVEHIRQFRQTVIDLAAQGRLVPEEMAGKSGRTGLPDEWNVVPLADLLDGDSQNGYSRKPDDAPDGIPILRISAGTVRRDGIVAEEQHKLMGAVTSAHHAQYGLRPGDLLACRFNGNRAFVGRLSIYTGYLGIAPIYPDKLIRLRLRPGRAIPRLIQRFSESSGVRAEIESYCATTVGNWGISATNLKRVRIPLPPLEEQHRILSRVDHLIGICDQLETGVGVIERASRNLLEATLSQALATG